MSKNISKKHTGGRIAALIILIIFILFMLAMAFMPTGKAAACGEEPACAATPIVTYPKCRVGFSSNPVLTGQQVTLSNTGDRNGTAAFWTVLGSGMTGQDVPVSFTEPGTKTVLLTVQWTNKIGSTPCYGSLVVNLAPAATATLDPTTTVVSTPPVVIQSPVSSKVNTTTTVKSNGGNSPAINGDHNNVRITIYQAPTQPTFVPTTTPSATVTSTATPVPATCPEKIVINTAPRPTQQIATGWWNQVKHALRVALIAYIQAIDTSNVPWTVVP